jgi:hypothetical protein
MDDSPIRGVQEVADRTCFLKIEGELVRLKDLDLRLSSAMVLPYRDGPAEPGSATTPAARAACRNR